VILIFPAGGGGSRVPLPGVLSQQAVAVSRNHRGEYSLWQKRFWEHTIRDDGDFERCADYIHFNPVKHGLVSSPAVWPFSSRHRYARTGWLAEDWGGSGLADNVNFGERGD
jgi:putative transposase